MADTPDLDQALTHEDARTAYRWILGKPPKLDAEIDTIVAKFKTCRDLQHFLISSKAALHRSLRLRFGDEKWVMAEVLEGRRLWLNLCDRHVSLGCLTNSWEPHETAFMRHVLKPGDAIVDAGANIGWFSLLAEQCVGAKGRVYAFEPQSRVLHYLQRTVEENGLSGQIQVFDYALSDSQTNAMMMWDPAGGNMGRAWLATQDQRDRPGTELGPVKTARLDDLIPESMINFLKIDTEGAEMRVLRGAVELLSRSRPIIMLEIVPALLQAVSQCTPSELIDFFAQRNYSGFVLSAEDEPAHLTPVDRRAVHTISTWIFLPNEGMAAIMAQLIGLPA